MRLLWLCKARYMNHDVIADRYARLFELPQRMAASAEVAAVCLGYRWSDAGEVSPDLAGRWRRFNLPRTLMVGWMFQLLRFARSFRPACVIASSDCLNIILGAFLARLTGAALVADLYDDYSTFGMARVPGMGWLYRRSLAQAAGISVVSRTLGEAVVRQFPGKPVLVLESTIDSGVFQPQRRNESRERLGLAQGSRLVGFCGGLNAMHGADVVFAAMPLVSTQAEDVTFVVAGRESPDCPLPKRADVLHLGALPHSDMPYFFSAMDVVIVSLADNQFGHLAFPQKAYEVIACKTPPVVADVGSLGLLFEGLPDARYLAGSAEDLASRVVWQLEHKVLLEVEIPTWDLQAERMLGFVEACTGVV